MAALERAGREAQKPHEREHTTPFLWDQPERFRASRTSRGRPGLDYSMSHRFTIDYARTTLHPRCLRRALHAAGPLFSLARHPRASSRRPRHLRAERVTRA